MKKGFFIVGVVAIVLLGSLFLNKRGDSFSLEGMVLATGESEVLMSKRSDLTIEDLEGLTRRQFAEKYPERAFTWRGPAPIRRNLKLKELL